MRTHALTVYPHHTRTHRIPTPHTHTNTQEHTEKCLLCANYYIPDDPCFNLHEDKTSLVSSAESSFCCSQTPIPLVMDTSFSAPWECPYTAYSETLVKRTTNTTRFMQKKTLFPTNYLVPRAIRTQNVRENFGDTRRWLVCFRTFPKMLFSRILSRIDCRLSTWPFSFLPGTIRQFSRVTFLCGEESDKFEDIIFSDLVWQPSTIISARRWVSVNRIMKSHRS